jgi:RNA polymerase sigma-70 factor (ECF subfamily)
MSHQLATTNWSLILNVEATSPEIRQGALAELCQAYWYPLYAYARRRGATPEDAADSTQGFFLHLIEKHALRGLDRTAVRFRAYLLASFKNFEADARDRATALKRGGGLLRITFDPALLERFAANITDDDSPERLYARQWALTLLERAKERVRTHYERTGRSAQFTVLGPYAMRRPESPASVASALGASEAAARVALHRLRRRLGAELRAEVAATVGDPSEVESELRYLLGVLAGSPAGLD